MGQTWSMTSLSTEVGRGLVVGWLLSAEWVPRQQSAAKAVWGLACEISAAEKLAFSYVDFLLTSYVWQTNTYSKKKTFRLTGHFDIICLAN